jgi:hypothetical protein
MDDQRVDKTGYRSVNQRAKVATHRRIPADALFWIYIVGVVLVFYSGLIDHWPRWAWIWALVIGGLLCLWPLFVAFKDLRSLTGGRPLRFSLRGLLLIVPIISVLIWLFIQLDWIEKRERWRRHNRAAVRSLEGQAPGGLVRLFEPGVSRIEIRNGTKDEIDYVKRLFPEATVVGGGEVRDGN